MTKKDIDFIIETLEEAISWSEFANEYFAKKHNLKKDKEDVCKAISMLNEFKSQISAI